MVLSLALLCFILLVVFPGVLLPYNPLAGTLGFAPLPALYMLFLAATTIIDELVVEQRNEGDRIAASSLLEVWSMTLSN